ncbi:MAG: AAA family ATPase [Spirochaetaceae bacterium]|jgi:ATP-dependent 26S proteasome regulatory subunit|nr:AAA family ATPase [Spirochaetaceae bacterium]
MNYYSKNKEYIDTLPEWAREFANKYGSKTANLYILHGNIRDYLPHQSNEGEFTFTRIQDYIAERIFGNKNIIVFYDRSSGVVFLDNDYALDYQKFLRARYPEVDDDSDFMTANPEESFFYLEKYFLARIPKDKREQCRIVLIIDYAETIVPPGDLGRYNEEDRFCMVTLNRWAVNPIFTAGDISIILLTENLADISPRLAGSPATVKVNVPFPSEEVREKFLEFKLKEGKLILDRGLSAKQVAAMTSGLNLMNLNRLISENFETTEVLNMEYLRQKKKEIIETEAAGLLEFLETDYNLSHVSGHDFVKKRFKNAAKAIKMGRLDVLPMGYLIAGPVGTGKSFIVSAFAGEIGIPMVKFRNFRSKWQGDTESNLERILNILKSMAPVAVMIDEADAFLGDRDQDGDSGTSNRVFAQIASFMGNTEYRGRIIWFLITCRPDLVPIDLKRQGRAEEHLALFYPETDEEREDLFKTLVRKLDLDIRNFPVSELFKKYKHEYSGADLEALLVRAKLLAAMEDRIYIRKDDMEEAMADFVPAAYPHAIELQNLVAVVECTSKEMLPGRLRKKPRSDLIREIQEIKLLLGE